MWKKLFCLLLLLPMGMAQAGIIILGTRVIYPAEQKSVNVKLENKNPKPALAQAWIDNGDPNVPPEQVKTPFVITPPLSRIEANKGQTLRITYTGDPLPTDRESIFYFNLLDIPPKPSAQMRQENPNFLQIAVRSRIKLFYRPQSLPMSAEEAYQQVEWRVASERGKPVVIVNNKTPYYITYATIELKQGAKTAKAKDADMVAPFSQVSYPLSSAVSGQATVHWSVINDFGGKQSGTATLR
ncbi:fimbria/pilus periplasmic chaperone [Gallibacterium trehalosifermentans]|uniref:Fimbria/pilus periplasmic chaperone n=1 Tax=Gallibacterium trehalosifermentans TaxID=516935 RepID=A0ABV6H021_9PAST